MGKIFVVLLILFLHIVDDYYSQGILAKLKQKEWWQEYAPQQLYRYDYIVALAIHSFSWSYMIMLPIALANSFDVGVGFIVAFVINAILHGIVDDLKANRKKINLLVDQAFHFFQIAVTAIAFVKGII